MQFAPILPETKSPPPLEPAPRKIPALQLILRVGGAVPVELDSAVALAPTEVILLPNKLPTLLLRPTVGLPARELPRELPLLELLLPALGLGQSALVLLPTFRLSTVGLPPLLELPDPPPPPLEEERSLSLLLQ